MTLRTVQFSAPITSLRINTAEWPEIAGAKTFDENHTSYVRVMRHRSGQSIVYGMHSTGGKDSPGAEFVDVGGNVAAAVLSVSRHCGCEDAIAHEVIGKL